MLARAPRLAHAVVPLGLVVTIIACTEPLEPLPSVYDDPALAQQVEDADGFEGALERASAFVSGRSVHYWGIAGAPERAAPVYRLCRPEQDEACAPIDHPPIVGELPGDDAYTPYHQVHWVELPEGWSGQLGSVEDIEAEVAALGLAAPRSTSELWHCPIAAADAQIEVADGMTVLPEAAVYVDGREARCFDFSATRPHRAVFPNGSLFERHVYVLTRDGEEAPLHEGLRMEDLTGDGDQHDTNNIFGVELDDDDYTPLWKVVRVTVPADFASIDTSGDETVADYRDAADMFDVAPDYTITARDGQILDYTITDVLINCPLQSAEGAL